MSREREAVIMKRNDKAFYDSLPLYIDGEERLREKIREHSWLLDVVTDPETWVHRIEEKDRCDVIAHLAEDIVTADYIKSCEMIYERLFGSRARGSFSDDEMELARGACMKYLQTEMSDDEIRLYWVLLVDVKREIAHIDDIPSIDDMRAAIAEKMARRIYGFFCA